MELSTKSPAKPTQLSEAVHSLSGHQPLLFKGQKAAILNLLMENRGRWVPACTLASVALQYSARVKELRDDYTIENRTERHSRQVQGSFRLVGCPGDAENPTVKP